MAAKNQALRGENLRKIILLFLQLDPPLVGGVLRPQLVGDKGLAAVEAVVAREHVAHAAAQRNKLQPLPAKQLESQQDGGDQGVCGSAEHADQTDGTGKPGGQAQQGACHTAKGGTDEEAGHHLAAFEAYCQGQGGQEDLAGKIPRAARLPAPRHRQ